LTVLCARRPCARPELLREQARPMMFFGETGSMITEFHRRAATDLPSLLRSSSPGARLHPDDPTERRPGSLEGGMGMSLVARCFAALLTTACFHAFPAMAGTAATPDLVPLHRGFDCLGASGIERGQVGIGYLDGDAPGRAGLA